MAGRPRLDNQAITRRVHPHVAERLAQLEEMGWDLESIVIMAESILHGLACNASDYTADKYDYAAGILFAQVMSAANAIDPSAKEYRRRDWRVNKVHRFTNEQKGRIKDHLDRYHADHNTARE